MLCNMHKHGGRSPTLKNNIDAMSRTLNQDSVYQGRYFSDRFFFCWQPRLCDRKAIHRVIEYIDTSAWAVVNGKVPFSLW